MRCIGRAWAEICGLGREKRPSARVMAHHPAPGFSTQAGSRGGAGTLSALYSAKSSSGVSPARASLDCAGRPPARGHDPAPRTGRGRGTLACAHAYARSCARARAPVRVRVCVCVRARTCGMYLRRRGITKSRCQQARCASVRGRVACGQLTALCRRRRGGRWRGCGHLGQLADVVAHHKLELGRAKLALLVAQRAVAREARKVRRRHVDARGEVLPPPPDSPGPGPRLAGGAARPRLGGAGRAALSARGVRLARIRSTGEGPGGANERAAQPRRAPAS